MKNYYSGDISVVIIAKSIANIYSEKYYLIELQCFVILKPIHLL